MHHQEIRGYFFDPDKNKYFKLAPHSSAIGHPYRRDTVLAKQQAVPAASSAATRPKTVLRSFAAALRQRETWATAQGGENAYERLVGGFSRVSHFAHSSPILTRPAEVVRAMCVSADERWLAMALQLQTQVVKVHDMEGGDEDSVAFEGWGVSDLCWSPLAGDATLGATISGGESPVSLLMLQRLTGEVRLSHRAQDGLNGKGIIDRRGCQFPGAIAVAVFAVVGPRQSSAHRPRGAQGRVAV